MRKLCLTQGALMADDTFRTAAKTIAGKVAQINENAKQMGLGAEKLQNETLEKLLNSVSADSPTGEGYAVTLSKQSENKPNPDTLKMLHETLHKADLIVNKIYEGAVSKSTSALKDARIKNSTMKVTQQKNFYANIKYNN